MTDSSSGTQAERLSDMESADLRRLAGLMCRHRSCVDTMTEFGRGSTPLSRQIQLFYISGYDMHRSIINGLLNHHEALLQFMETFDLVVGHSETDSPGFDTASLGVALLLTSLSQTERPVALRALRDELRDYPGRRDRHSMAFTVLLAVETDTEPGMIPARD